MENNDIIDDMYCDITDWLDKRTFAEWNVYFGDTCDNLDEFGEILKNTLYNSYNCFEFVQNNKEFSDLSSDTFRSNYDEAVDKVDPKDYEDKFFDCCIDNIKENLDSVIETELDDLDSNSEEWFKNNSAFCLLRNVSYKDFLKELLCSISDKAATTYSFDSEYLNNKLMEQACECVKDKYYSDENFFRILYSDYCELYLETERQEYGG